MPKPRKSCVESLESRTLFALTTLGPEFRVNTTTAGNQFAPAVATDLAGDSVVVWVSPDADRAGTDIYAQRYAANGTPVGGEFRVNTITAGTQSQPDVAMDDAGDFTIVWTSDNVPGGSGRDVVARSFNPDGSSRTASDTLVNQTVAGDQESPSVASDSSGNFEVAWDSDSSDGNDYDIFVRPFRLSAAPSGNEVRFNTSTPGPQTDPSIDMNANGNFVVVWSSAVSASSTDYDIYERRVVSAVVENPVLVSDDASTDYQILPSVAITGDNRLVVVWSSYGGDGSNFGIKARTYSSSGTPNAIFNVNTFTTGQQTHAAVDASAAGEFTVVWDSDAQDGSQRGIYRQSYTFAGTPVGGETRVNSTTGNDESFPAISLNADGDAVVVWQDGSTAINGNGADGSGYGVFAQRFGHPPTVTAATFNYLNGQSLTFNFSEDVSASFTAADLQLVNTSTNTTVPTTNIHVTANSGTSFTVAFTGTLANGNYAATLLSSGVTDASGTPLDGNGDGVAGDNFTLSFFVLTGDINRDRKVDILDLGILSTHWQQSGQNYSTGDLNGDGVVDIVDLGLLSTNWQQTVPAPVVAIASPPIVIVPTKKVVTKVMTL